MPLNEATKTKLVKLRIGSPHDVSFSTLVEECTIAKTLSIGSISRSAMISSIRWDFYISSSPSHNFYPDTLLLDSIYVSKMALAYPEGECFFKRSVLNTSQADGYHADKIEDFYSKMMVEYVWNQEAYHGSVAAKSPKGRAHP